MGLILNQVVEKNIKKEKDLKKYLEENFEGL